MELDTPFLSTIGGELVDLANRLDAAERSRNWAEVASVSVVIAKMSVKVLAEAKQLNARILISDKDPGVRVSIR